MNKIYGLISEFAPVRKDASRVIISYGMQPEPDGEHATWYEVDFYKKQTANPSLDAIKTAVKADINARTDEKILKGFVWTPEGGQPISVWLSKENQDNFSEAQRLAAAMPEAVLPINFKLGETADGEPVYHEFQTAEELTGFYLQAFGFLKQTLEEGWQEKDSIDWTPYDPEAAAAAAAPKKGKKSSK